MNSKIKKSYIGKLCNLPDFRDLEGSSWWLAGMVERLVKREDKEVAYKLLRIIETGIGPDGHSIYLKNIHKMSKRIVKSIWKKKVLYRQKLTKNLSQDCIITS